MKFWLNFILLSLRIPSSRKITPLKGQGHVGPFSCRAIYCSSLLTKSNLSLSVPLQLLKNIDPNSRIFHDNTKLDMFHKWYYFPMNTFWIREKMFFSRRNQPAPNPMAVASWQSLISFGAPVVPDLRMLGCHVWDRAGRYYHLQKIEVLIWGRFVSNVSARFFQSSNVFK